MTSASPAPRVERHLRVLGTRNLRDVGGYPAGPGRAVRWRRLLRSDALDRLPAASVDHLLGLDVRQVIDLRWPHELVEAPSAFAAHPGVRYRSIPLLEDDPAPPAGLAAMYRHIFDDRRPQLVDVVRALLEPSGLPAIVGCAAGKDRTGVAVALVLAAVGVPPDVIAADYHLTAELFAQPVDDLHLGDDWRGAPLQLECPPEHILGALDHLDRRHGGPHGFLRAGGLSESELARLSDTLTERIGAPAG